MAEKLQGLLTSPEAEAAAREKLEALLARGLLSVELSLGLLGQVYDGLQNPLPRLAEQCGFFLQRGMYLDALDKDSEWDFTAVAKAAADTLDA